MKKRVRILSPHPESISQKLYKELRTIVDDAQRCLGEYELPTIVLTQDCFFRISPRNFAAVRAGRPTYFYICPDLATQPISRIRGIFYHEMGHLFQMIEHEVTGRNHLNGLDYEQDADQKVEDICDIRILYDDELIQRVGRGAKGFGPRPRGLK
jgi:hypothetical protein